MAPLILCLTLTLSAAETSDWQQVKHDDGITIWQRDVPGSAFIEFRGRGEIDANIMQVLAVLSDDDRKTEWMMACSENRRLVARGFGRSVIYNRTESHFPLIADRDVVFETSLRVDPKTRTIYISAWSVEHPRAPEVDGVVRMPKLKLSWTLIAPDPNTTDATYQVHADPGGALPHWIVNLVSKELPFKTLTNLRKQVVKDGYDENLALVEVAYDWDTFWPR